MVLKWISKSLKKKINAKNKEVTTFWNLSHQRVKPKWWQVVYNSAYYEVVYGSPCCRPEKVCLIILPWLALRKNWLSSEKNSCYSFLSSSKKNSTFRTGWLSIIRLSVDCPWTVLFRTKPVLLRANQARIIKQTFSGLPVPQGEP